MRFASVLSTRGFSSRSLKPVAGPCVRPDRRRDADAEEIVLGAAELWSAEPEGRLRIRCEWGTVWVTQAGCERDVILEPGRAFEAAGPGKVVVQALTPACFGVGR